MNNNETQTQEQEEQNLYYQRDSLSVERVKQLSPFDQTTHLYFGDIYLGNAKEESGALWSNITNLIRSPYRGWWQAAGSTAKAGISFIESSRHEIEKYYDQNVKVDMVTRLNAEKATGIIKTEEEYQKRLKDIQEKMAWMAEEDKRKIDESKARSIALMSRIDEHVNKLTGWAKRQDKDIQWVSDLLESSPSWLASFGVFALTKNPYAAAAVMGAYSGAVTAGDTAQQALEKGATVEDAFGVGAVTGASSGSLEFLGGWFVGKLWEAPLAKQASKRVLASRLMDKVVGKGSTGSVGKPLSVALRASAAGAVEELATESGQAAIEIYIPRAYGLGTDFNSMYEDLSNIYYQGVIGGLGGGIMGGVGTYFTARRFHKEAKAWAKSKGADEGQATRIADTATEVFTQKETEMLNVLTKEINSLPASEESYASSVEALRELQGGLENKERTKVNSRFKNMLDSSVPQGKEGGENTVGATILTESAILTSEATGEPLDNVVNSYSVTMRENINPADKTTELHAVDSEGNIIGSASNSVGKRMIAFAKNGDPAGVIHESTHLFLNAVAEAYARFKDQPERLSPIVLNIIQQYGVPSGENGYFSEEQQERAAADMTRTILEGESISPELDMMSAKIRKSLHNIDNSLSVTDLKDSKFRATFAKIFAKEEAILPSRIPSKERIKELNQTMKNIERGQKPSVRDLLEIAQWVRFGAGASPYTIGYSLVDYVREHPQYSGMTSEQKINALTKFGFDLSDFVTTFGKNYDQMVTAIEQNPEGLLLAEDIEGKKVSERKIKFNEAARIYPELFAGVNINRLKNQIRELRNKGLVVLSEQQVKKMVSGVQTLLEEYKETSKRDNQTERNRLNRTVRYAESILDNLELAGMETDKLRQEIQQAREEAKGQDADKMREIGEKLLSRVNNAVDSMSIKYFQSEQFLQDNGVLPPSIDQNLLAGQIGLAMVKAGRKSTSTEFFSTARILEEVGNVLRKNKIPQELRNSILSKLATKSFNQLTGSQALSIAETITNEVFNNYQKETNAKILDEWKKLVKAKNAKKINPDDRLAIEWIDKKIMKGKHDNTYFNNLNFNESIGKDLEGNDVYLTQDQKELAAVLRDIKWKTYKDDILIGNEQLADAFVQLSIISNITRSFPQVWEAKEKQRIADKTQLALDEVKSRKPLASGALRALQWMDSVVMAGPLGGLRSNLIAVLGENLTNSWDTLSEERNRDAHRGRIFRNVKDQIALATKGNDLRYLAHLKKSMPYANTQPGDLMYPLRKFTRGQLLNIWLLSQDPDGRKGLTHTFGNDTENILKELDRRTPETDKKVGRIMKAHLKALYPSISKTFFRINGQPIGFVENYWPNTVKYQSSGAIAKDMDVFVPLPTTRKNESFTFERVGLSEGQEFDIQDAYDVFTRYVKNATNFIYVTEKINDLSRIFANKELQEAITEKYGVSMLEAIRDDISFNLQLVANAKMTKLDKLFNVMISNSVIGTLGLNFWSALKQVPGFINYAERMPAGDFVRFLPKFFTNPKKNWDYMMKNYASLRSRLEDAFPTIWGSNSAMYEESLTGIFGQGAVKKIGEQRLVIASQALTDAKRLAMLPTRYGDGWANVIGGWCYEQHLREQMESDPNYANKTEKEKQAEIELELINAMETTQQSGFNTTKGAWQRSDNAVIRGLLTFTSQPAQYVRKMREAAYKYRNNEIDTPQFVKTMAIYGAIQPFLYSLLSSPSMYINLFKSLFGDDDDSYKKELYLSSVRPYLDNVSSAWGGMWGSLFMFIADTIAKKHGQKTYGDNGGLNPIVYKDIVDGVKKMSKDNVSGSEFIDGLVDIVQLGTPIPLQRFKKMLKGVSKTVSEHQLYYFGMMLGISENQINRLIKEIKD